MRPSTLILTLLMTLTMHAEVINLGNRPWRFTRVVTATSSLATGLDVMGSHQRVPQANDGRLDTRHTGRDTLVLDLLKVQQASAVELTFGGDSVRQVQALVEVSRDQHQWTALTHGHTTLPCLNNYQNDITTVNNTVGYARVVVSTSVTLPVASAFRFVRVSINQCMGDGENLLQPQLSELEVHPVGTHHPDSHYLAPALDDSQWQVVGIPHCYNEQDTYLNATWLNSALQTQIMAGFEMAPRVPYTDAGYTMIRAWVQDVADRAINNGVIDLGVSLSQTQRAELMREAGVDITTELYNSGYYLQIVDAPAGIDSITSSITGCAPIVCG